MEHPGGFVDKDGAEGLGVVGLEALDHEFDRGVVLARGQWGFYCAQGGLHTMFARENPVMSKTTV